MNLDFAALSGSPQCLAPPFASSLVFPDVDAEVLRQEDALNGAPAWTSFLDRTLARPARPRLHAVR